MRSDSNDEQDFLMHCMTDADLSINLNDMNYYCSQNNNATREHLDSLIKKYLRSVDMEMETERFDDECELINTELAVFSGNLFRLILGEQQPKYYLCKLADHDPENSSHADYKHPYFRACNMLQNLIEWHELESSHADILENNIKDMSSILVAGHFLGEIDWSDGNFGVIINQDSNAQAVRLDPGLSFTDMFFKSNDKLNSVMSNLLLNYVHEENPDDPYIDSMIDHETLRYCHHRAEALFANNREILKTMERISNLGKSDFTQCMQHSFQESHYPFAKIIIKRLMQRVHDYDQAFQEIQRMRDTDKKVLRESVNNLNLFSPSIKSGMKRTKTGDTSDLPQPPRKK